MWTLEYYVKLYLLMNVVDGVLKKMAVLKFESYVTQGLIYML
jgi:hypothetical protein